MADFPHHYAVEARGEAEGPVTVESEGLPALETAPPTEFGGPGDRWSPETLLVGAVADCFILTFRAVARASKLSWRTLRVGAEGTLDRVERTTRFTGVALRAELALPDGEDAEKARRCLDKSKRACIVTSSLACETTLEPEVRTDAGG